MTLDRTFDLRPLLAAQEAERTRVRWRVRASGALAILFLATYIWLGFIEGLGLFVLAVAGISGPLAVAFLLVVRRRGNPIEVHVSSSGIDVRYSRGERLGVVWGTGRLHLRIYAPKRARDGARQIAGPQVVQIGWRSAMIPAEAREAIVASAMAHPLVTVLVGELERGEPASRTWEIRRRRDGDSKLPRTLVA